MAKRHEASSTNVEDYWQLFVNRRAYVLQAMRPHPESGRYYYFRPKAAKNGESHSLTAATIRRHLEAFPKICAGDPDAGPIARLSRRERFQWLVAPRSNSRKSSRLLPSPLWKKANNSLPIGVP